MTHRKEKSAGAGPPGQSRPVEHVVEVSGLENQHLANNTVAAVASDRGMPLTGADSWEKL